MKTTDIFNEEMKVFFEAAEGAYTTFTGVEMGKRTFNVKSVMRKMLIDRMGRENIPIVNVTPNQSILFEICNKAKIYGLQKVDIPCKFSKKDKDEMTIYFNAELIELFNAEAGDTWYIYFKKDSQQPIIGIMSKAKWSNLFDDSDIVDLSDPEEKATKELKYVAKVEDMRLLEEPASERAEVQVVIGKGIVRSLGAQDAAIREKNRKKKGNRGEEIVIEIEKRRLRKLGRPDLVSKITHVAKYKDGLGYDVISTDVGLDGKEVEIYIEVKSTSGNIDMPFYVTARELEVSRKYRDLYYIYRVYEMKESTDSAKYYRLPGTIDENYELTPTEYLAKRNK